MIAEEEALARVLGLVSPLPVVEVALDEAWGLFLARELRATVPIPRFDNSAMDGYALRAADGPRLRVIGDQAAGADRGLALGLGEAIRIFTGAPMPAGADAVVMQEETRRDGDWLDIVESVAPGENIRRAGGDLCEGQKIASAGEELKPPLLALLASQGLAGVPVRRRPTVAILATGDELVPPGQPLGPGTIHETNGVMLAALTQRLGARVTRLGIAPDEPDALRSLLERGLDHDALIVSGGVSVGEHDLVRQTLADLGAPADVWRVAVRPGKPFLFAQHSRCCVFGLPGNPVSTFVTFHCFVRPALLKMLGARELAARRFPVALGSAVENPGDRPHYLRGRVSGGRFSVMGKQESHALYGLSQCNALLRLAPGEAHAAGATVEVCE